MECVVTTLSECGLVGVRCAVRVQTKGATPLFVASEHGCVEAVRMLLEVGGAVNQAMVCGFVHFWGGQRDMCECCVSPLCNNFCHGATAPR